MEIRGSRVTAPGDGYLKICIVDGGGCTRATNYLGGGVVSLYIYNIFYFSSVLSLVLRLVKHKCDAKFHSLCTVVSFIKYNS